MFRLILLQSLFVLTYGSVIQLDSILAKNWRQTGRVVGGEDADIKDAPYQVSMLLARDDGSVSHTCGGSIIRSTTIVSAAHCAYRTMSRNWMARAGSTYHNSGGQTMNVVRFIYPPEFDIDTVDYDISLFILAWPLDVDGISIATIRLPIQNASVYENEIGMVTGWGATEENGEIVDTLQMVTIPIVNHQRCTEIYEGINRVNERMFCAGNLDAGGQDACQGDFGGPLVIGEILTGVTSWGMGCARPGYPGVWTRVSSFSNWIDQQRSLD